MRENGLAGAWIPRLGIPRGGIVHRSRRWHVFTAAMAWGALVAAAIASGVVYLASDRAFLVIVPLEFTGVYTAALLADAVQSRRERKRMDSPSILDQRELLKEELEENLAMLRGVTGLPAERLAEEQLLIIHEFRRCRSRLRARQTTRRGIRRLVRKRRRPARDAKERHRTDTRSSPMGLSRRKSPLLPPDPTPVECRCSPPLPRRAREGRRARVRRRWRVSLTRRRRGPSPSP